MISIDSSTKATGIAYWENGKLKNTILITCNGKNMEERLPNMICQIYLTLSHFSPDIIWIEETVVGRNAQVQRFLTRLTGAIMGWAVQNGCEFNAIRPTQWRKYCDCDFSGKREQLKKQSIEHVINKYNIDKGDDIADAICIGEAIINMYSERDD